MSAIIAALCGGIILGLWLQGSCICVGLIALAGIGYALYKSTLFHGKSVPVGNKAVLITGCDSGFGKLLAEKLDAIGFTVIACCMFPGKGGADDLRRKCSSRLHILRLDVTSNEDVNAAVKYVQDKIGNELWALVNNAGISWTGEIEWTDVTTFEKIYSVNVFGVIRVSKAFLPLVRKARGRVVNVASMAGRFALSGFSAYCSSKFACIGLSDALRREMKKFGVTVHTIEPAFYKTNMTAVDVQVKMARSTWEKTPVEIKEAYTEGYFNAFMENVLHILTKAVNPNTHEVVDCMLDAVTSERPKLTYAITLSYVIKRWIMGAVPTRVQDLIMKKTEPRYPISPRD